MVNQILGHIGNTSKNLIQYTQDKGIFVGACSPVAPGIPTQNLRGKKNGRKV